MSEDSARLVRMFRAFVVEFRDESPVYEQLSGLCANRPELATALLAAPGRQRRAILLFGAVQYVLHTLAPDHPLAAYFPTLGGDRRPDDRLDGAFTDLVAAYPDHLEQLCATRRTQTNEARRSALLRPAFTVAAEGRPLGLIELGTSAGLLLLPDRYGYDYAGQSRRETIGRADAPGPLVFECEVRGTGWPAMGPLPPISSRTGIDLNPIDATDDDAVTWLQCLIWPEHVGRLDRLEAALAESRTVRPRLVAGDMFEALPAAVSEVDADALPVVFTSHAVTYVPSARQPELVATLADIGARRDIAAVLVEAPRCGIQLFSPDAPGADESDRVGTLTLVRWRDGQPTVTSLGHTGPHGAWLSWQPEPFAYRPGYSVGSTAP